MPTTITKTVKSAGGDYTSLAAWEAAQEADLTATDEIRQAECYAFTDTARLIISGWTTDATRYIRIYAATGEGHAGVWSTSKFNLSNSTGFQETISQQEDYVRFEGLQIERTGSDLRATFSQVVAAAPASSDIRIDRCLIRGGGFVAVQPGTVYLGSGLTTIRNSAIYGGVADGINVQFESNSPTVNVDNCTLAGHAAYGVNRGSGTVTLRNCYSGGNTTDAYNGTMTLTTCAHDTATSFTGSTASTAYATGSGAKFTNITSGSEDFHLQSGSALIDAGTDLSGTYTVDFEGGTRSAPFDIGADEFVSAGGGASSVELVSSGRLVGGSRLAGGVLVGA